MYTVYKITNQINGKCYIGSTINLKQRWRTHRSIMNQSNSPQYNYPLYCAFRKYGIDNFSFEVIKDDFNSIEEMQSYEKDMIIFYDSVKNGYNQTYFTDCISNSIENLNKYQQKIQCKCAWVDKNQNIIEKYSSYHEAARAQGEGEDQDWASIIRRVCKGETKSFRGKIFRDLDKDDKVISLDINFDNIIIRNKQQNASNKNNYLVQGIIGIPLDNPDKPIYFKNITEASIKLNIPRKSISDCINGSKRYSVVHNIIWRKLTVYGDIIENEINIEEKIKEYNIKNPVINGKRHSLKEWCNIYKIKPATVRARIRSGMDVEQALTTPLKRKRGE